MFVWIVSPTLASHSAMSGRSGAANAHPSATSTLPWPSGSKATSYASRSVPWTRPTSDADLNARCGASAPRHARATAGSDAGRVARSAAAAVKASMPAAKATPALDGRSEARRRPADAGLELRAPLVAERVDGVALARAVGAFARAANAAHAALPLVDAAWSRPPAAPAPAGALALARSGRPPRAAATRGRARCGTPSPLSASRGARRRPTRPRSRCPTSRARRTPSPRRRHSSSRAGRAGRRRPARGSRTLLLRRAQMARCSRTRRRSSSPAARTCPCRTGGRRGSPTRPRAAR